jgi:P27 family predicted phage terminase small subunit
MGRPAKSLREHELHGTKRQVKEPSGFVGGRPKYPKHLSAPAKKIYKQAVALLEARQVLTEGDESLIALYATVYARWIEAKDGLVGNLMVKIPLLDSNGQVHFVLRPNPLLKIATEAEGRLLTIAKTLGLSPVDRERTKRTLREDTRDGVVPGSIADLYPDLLPTTKDVIPFVPLPPETDDEETENV